MFLPQVVKKRARDEKGCAYLQPFMEAEKALAKSNAAQGRFLIATVKGDVHDIGKEYRGRCFRLQ